MRMSARRAAIWLAAAILTGAAALAATAPAHADPGRPTLGLCPAEEPILRAPASVFEVGVCHGHVVADCTVDHDGETWVHLLHPVSGYVPAAAFQAFSVDPLPPCEGDPAAPAQGLG